MTWFAALAILFAARPTLADTCIKPADLPAEQTKLTVTNTKSRDTALAAAGLKVVAAPVVAVGAQAKKPAGNIVWIDTSQGCEDVEILFVIDKANRAYRLMPKITVTDVPLAVCGPDPACEPMCGMPPSPIKIAFRLPDKAVYSGEREVAWATKAARVSYQLKCGEPPTPTKGTAASKTECDKLRAENARLRAELDKLQAQQKAEIENLKRERAQLSKDLKN